MPVRVLLADDQAHIRSALRFLIEQEPETMVAAEASTAAALTILVKETRPDLVLPASLLPYFSTYRWPGNVREMENVIERVVVLARGDEITVNDLPEFLRRERPAAEEFHFDLPPQGISLGVEKELIVRALEKFDWNQTHAARYLDISRKTLIYRMEKFGLRKEQAEAEDETAG